MFAASKTASVSGGYQISRSLRFNSADSTYLNRTPASAGNRQTFTFSTWVKRSTLSTATFNMFGGGASATNFTEIYFSAQDDLRFYDYASSTSLYSSSLYRDVSAWYHIVYAIDTTQATAANRVKIYVNNTQLTSFATANYPAQNANMYINTAGIHSLGALNYTASVVDYFNGYMTEVNFIDGQALTPSSFGETNAQTGVWQPKAYSGSYGTNGFYLNFSDNSNTTAATLGKDYSGNGNNWTPNNFSVTAGAGNDSLVDSPTSYGTDTGVGGEVRGNYATLNPLALTSGYGTIANGNLDYTGPTGYGISSATIGMSSGKWYFEMTATSAGVGCGVSLSSALATQYLGQNASGWSYFNDGLKYNNGSGASYGVAFTTGDVIGVAFDADVGTLVFYKNGATQGTAFTGLTSGPYFFTVSDGSSPDQRTCTANFGQRPFAYTAPSGFKALCTQNLPTPTIGATSTTLATQFFAPVLWTGTSATLSVGVGFQPDLVWIKPRNTASYGHKLFDSVRGATKYLESNSTDAEGTVSGLTSFDAGGFTVGSYAGTNSSSYNFVAWNWRASNATAVTNTAGTITSTVSANTTSGFSVVTYGGNGANSTIGHGIGTAPSMVIVKRRGAADAWIVYHASLGNTNLMVLNSTAAVSTSSAYWNNTSPTSTVFTVGTATEVNANGSTYVAYCFAPVAGYSAFGSYTGNGSADGPFVYTGMRPAYVMVKRTNSSGTSWNIFDTTRSPYNVTDDVLFADLSNAEVVNESTAAFDVLSNGFKLRTTGTSMNGSSDTYIYMAFASAPLKFSLAR